MKEKNPWAARHPNRTGTRPSTGGKSGSSTPSTRTPSPRKVLIRSRPSKKELQPSAERATSGRRSVQRRYKLVRVGCMVKLSWRLDAAYGGGTKDFTGEVVAIDDWITVMDSQGVICHVPLSYVTVEQL
jgi:hypothetical protein